MVSVRGRAPGRPRSVAVVLGSAVLVGCAGGVAEPGEPVRTLEPVSFADLEREAREHGWTEQADVLATGSVSRADYEQAIDHVRTCAEQGGNGISEPELSPIDNLTLEFGFPVGASDDEEIWALSDACLQRWFWSVSIAYRATHDAVMDADIRDASLACLADRGYVMSGDIRNAQDMAVRMPFEAEHDLAECIVSAAEEVRPDLDGVSVSW